MIFINRTKIVGVAVVSLSVGLLSGCTGGVSSIRANYDEQVTVRMQKKPDNMLAKNIVEVGGNYRFRIQHPSDPSEDYQLLVSALKESANQTDGFIEVMDADGSKHKKGQVFVKIDHVKMNPEEGHGEKSEGGTYRKIHFGGGADIWFSIAREDVIAAKSKLTRNIAKQKTERNIVGIENTYQSFKETISVRHPLSKTMPTDEKLRSDLTKKMAKKYIGMLMPKKVRKSMPLISSREVSDGVRALVRGNINGAEDIFQNAEQSDKAGVQAAAKNNLAVLYTKIAGDELRSSDEDRINELLAKAKVLVKEAFDLQPENMVISGNMADIDQWVGTRIWIMDQMAAVQESKSRSDRSSTNKLRMLLRR